MFELNFIKFFSNLNKIDAQIHVHIPPSNKLLQKWVLLKDPYTQKNKKLKT